MVIVTQQPWPGRPCGRRSAADFAVDVAARLCSTESVIVGAAWTSPMKDAVCAGFWSSSRSRVLRWRGFRSPLRGRCASGSLREGQFGASCPFA